jgi:hypothetical protein
MGEAGVTLHLNHPQRLDLSMAFCGRTDIRASTAASCCRIPAQ